MNNTKLTDKIFDVASLFVGSVRGGLAYVNVLASLIFAGISGAALADVGGLGNIEIRAMRDEGYDDGTTMGVTLASSTIGPIFPPSIPLIVYATVAEVSAVRLLIAGIVPALVIVVFLCLLIAFFGRKKNYPVHSSELSPKEKRKVLKEALPVLILPLFLVGSLLLGWFGPTEIGAVACVYTILISRFVYKELSLQSSGYLLGRSSFYSINNVHCFCCFSFWLVSYSIPGSSESYFFNVFHLQKSHSFVNFY